MGTYNSAVITNGGQSMIAQAVAGASLEFTTIKTSSYAYPAGTNLATLTTINGIKQSKDITGAAVYNSRVIKISAAVDNTGISTAYTINTVGIYAKVGSSAESLFAVVTASAADTMPAYDSKPYSYIYEINLTMQNAANVTVTVNAAGLVNVADLNAAKVEIRGEIADLKNDLEFITTTTRNLVDISAVKIGTAWNGSQNNMRAVVYIPVNGGNKYTITYDNLSSFDALYVFQKVSQNATSAISNVRIQSSNYTITANASATVFCIQFNSSNTIVSTDFDNINLQVEDGETASPYVQYLSAFDVVARDSITYVTPEMYGAWGDGVHDDTEYLQTALSSGLPVKAYKKYLITKPLVIDSSARVGTNFEFEYINYSGTDYAIKLYGRNGYIKGNCLNADNGHGVNIGGLGLTYQMNIDITLVRTPNGICYRLGGSEPVSECTISGNRCVYGINAVSFALDNYWVGQNTFSNITFSTDKQDAGYAFFANGSQHPLTALTCYNISFEGSHGGFHFVNSQSATPIETLNCFGLRTSEMSNNDGYNVIRYTGAGIIRGVIILDSAMLASFDFSNAQNMSECFIVMGRLMGESTSDIYGMAVGNGTTLKPIRLVDLP